MEQYEITNKNKVKRIPDRGSYDKESVYEILDSGRICHVGFSIDGQPFVIPTLFGREGNTIYLHGASTSRMLKNLEKGIRVCLTVTHLDGLVLARSAFHHSMNYRSVVLFGRAKIVEKEKKVQALKIISDNVIPGRWEEAREPNEKELKATTVLVMEIDQASCKVRTGPPSDDKEDLNLDIWAGILPISESYGAALQDEFVKNEPVPKSVKALLK